MGKKTKTPKKEPRRARVSQMISTKGGPEEQGPAPASGTRDPRLPPVGMVLQKRDRHGTVRCECTVEEGGIRYQGELYRSLSGAAMAAAKVLGLNNKTQNGFSFWGITKPTRPPRDPLVALDRAWERYQGSAAALVKVGITDENKSEVLAAIAKHAEAIEALRAQVA